MLISFVVAQLGKEEGSTLTLGKKERLGALKLATQSRETRFWCWQNRVVKWML